MKHATILVAAILTIGMNGETHRVVAAISTPEYDGLQVVLNVTEGLNRKVRVQVDGQERFYVHGASNLFPCRAPEPVNIRRLKWHSENADVYFESPRLGSGSIRFYAVGDPETLKKLFWHAFAATGDARARSSLVGNKNSHMYHLVTCNHLPAESDRILLESPHHALEEGYRECPLCFKDFPRVRDVLLERQMGLQMAAQTRALYPPVLAEDKQRKLSAIGEKVLSQWPSALRGYEYSFVLVESDAPNAFAAPAGKVFVTSALFEQAEHDSEIEAVLAHEIAHVEKRHGYRQYLAAKRAAAGAAVAAAVGGVIAARSGSSGAAAASFFIVLQQLVSSLVLVGHERRLEEEADAYAGIYFESRNDTVGTQALVQVLKKLKYSDELYGRLQDKANAFASHPGIEDRIDAATNSLMAKFPPDVVFQGMSGDGKVVATIQLEMQRSSKNIEVSGNVSKGFVASGPPPPPPKTEKYSVLATLTTTAELGESCEVKSMTIRSAEGKLTLENAEKTDVEPLDAVGILFETPTLQRKLLQGISDVELVLPNVKKWTKIASAD